MMVRSARLNAHPTGLTLLEVVLAMALFFGSLAMLSQLAWNGSRAAVQGRLRTQATIRCEAKLAELIVGAQARQSQQNTPYPEEPQWTWTLEAGPTQFPELEELKVTVTHQGNSALANTSVTLTRWVRTEELYTAALEAKEQAEQEKEAAATSSSSSSSGTSTPPSQSPYGTGNNNSGGNNGGNNSGGNNQNGQQGNGGGR